MKIKEATWDKIMSGTQKYSKASQKPVSSSVLIVDDDVGANNSFNLHAQHVEEDSDLEQGYANCFFFVLIY